jgi:nucleotidyltransferase/DNA polymerase involved in DNA repair
MKSRNDREGRYCGRTTSANGTSRCHVRSQTAHQVSAGTAARAMVARLVSKAEERRQMALAVRIMDEDSDLLRELAKR